MITNCYDIDTVLPILQGRLGWMQPTLSGSPVLTTQNKAATISRYYNGSFHSSTTIKSLHETQEDNSISDANFNAYLQTLDKSIISKCLNLVFNKTQLLEHSLVYERVANVRNVVIANGGNFVGYRIKVGQGSYAMQIDSVGLLFDGVATFNMYLFNDLKKAPVFTKSVTTAANDQTEIDLGWVVNYVSTKNKGGLFYLGYFQNEVVASNANCHAIDEQLTLWATSRTWGAYPFQAAQTDTTDFNRLYPSIVYRSYGMNPEISAYRDYTEVIIKNPHLFDEARGLAMSMICLEQAKSANRMNATERTQDVFANYELNLAFPTKDFPFNPGLKSRFMKEIARINENIYPKPEAQSATIKPGFDDMAFAYDTFNLADMPPRQNFY